VGVFCLSPIFCLSLRCFCFICFYHPSGPAILLRRNDKGDAGCWGDSELYTSTAFRTTEEIVCWTLRSCPVDSRRGMCRQDRNKAQRRWKTNTKFGKLFINHFDRGWLSVSCHHPCRVLARFPTAIEGSNSSKCPK